MHRTTRRIIFYLLVLTFVVLGVGITLYAKGVRIDSKTFGFTNVGGMYILPSPSDAMMKLDGEIVKRNSGIFQRGTLVNGLFPRNHVLELSAPGYKSWKRTVTVEPSRVAEIQYAVLTPEKPSERIGQNVKNFWLFGSAPLLLQNTSTYTLDGIKIPGNESVMDTNEDEFLTKTGTSSYAIVDVARATSTSLRSLIARTGNEATATSTVIQLDETNVGKFFVVAAHGIILGNIANNTVIPMVRTTSTIAGFAAIRNRAAWGEFDSASGTTRIVIYNRASQESEMLPDILAGKTKTIRWGDGNMLGIIQTNGDAYIYNLDRNKTFINRSSNIRDMYFTDDGSEAALVGNSLEILSFTDTDYSRFNVKDIENLQSLIWYRSNHSLFLQYPHEVLLLDIDDVHQENIIPVAETEISAYDSKSNRFFYLNDDVVDVLQFPEN